jgi:hypothetical protein
LQAETACTGWEKYIVGRRRKSQEVFLLLLPSLLSWNPRRQRKALTPAFSNAAVRGLTPVFFDSAYKVKNAWDAILESSENEAIIDVQDW